MCYHDTTVVSITHLTSFHVSCDREIRLDEEIIM